MIFRGKLFANIRFTKFYPLYVVMGVLKDWPWMSSLLQNFYHISPISHKRS